MSQTTEDLLIRLLSVLGHVKTLGMRLQQLSRTLDIPESHTLELLEYACSLQLITIDSNLYIYALKQDDETRVLN